MVTMPWDRGDFHHRPLAMAGLTSYRFCFSYGPGSWSYVMIGAKDDADAYREARRSTERPGVLEVWDEVLECYVKVSEHLNE